MGEKQTVEIANEATERERSDYCSLSKPRDRAYTISIFPVDGLGSIGYPVGPLVSRGYLTTG